MGRRYEYFCDNCSKEFGEQPHLNVKHMDAMVSHMAQEKLSNIEAQHPVKNNVWRQKQLSIPMELHFCNVDCFTTYLMNNIKPTIDKYLSREV